MQVDEITFFNEGFNTVDVKLGFVFVFMFLCFCLLVFDCMSALFNDFLCACGRIVVLLAAVMLSKLERRCLVFRPRDLVSLRLGLASYSLRKQPTFRWFPLEITSEKRAQKFPTDDASPPSSE